MFDVRFPVRVLSDGGWHRVSVAVSAGSLALYVDCVLVEDVKWGYPGMDISTDSLLVVGGIIEDSEIPFEGDLRQVTFLMGDPDAARDHCTLHLPVCEKAAKPTPTAKILHQLEVQSSEHASLRTDPD
nr:collagen alpha-1(V) chain-like [Paramormyrops kingsleyae]